MSELDTYDIICPDCAGELVLDNDGSYCLIWEAEAELAKRDEVIAEQRELLEEIWTSSNGFNRSRSYSPLSRKVNDYLEDTKDA